MFGFNIRKPKHKTVKFADGRRKLIIVTTVDCPACTNIKRIIPELAAQTSKRRIAFLHITGKRGPDILQKLEYQHPALRAVCKATPTIMSITNIGESFDFIMAPSPTNMTTKQIIEWWSGLSDKDHINASKYMDKPKEPENTNTSNTSNIIPYLPSDDINLSHDNINLYEDY